MKSYIFTLTSLFFTIYVGYGIAFAAEQVKVYPTNVKCGENVSIGVSGLNTQSQYSVVVECGNLSCANKFEPRVHAIQGKPHAVIMEKFDIAPGCNNNDENLEEQAAPTEIELPVLVPAGKYYVQLYNSENKSIATQTFNLVPNTSKICELKTSAIAFVNEEHSFELWTNQACVFNMSLIDPAGIRTPIASQFIEGNKTKAFTIKGDKLLKEGTYRLTAVATPQCDIELDRECKSTSFEVKNTKDATTPTSCVYSKVDKMANCYQCGSGFVCHDTNTCAKDTSSNCGTNEATSSVQTNNQSNRFGAISKLISQENGIILISGCTALIAILLFVLLFRFFRYRIKQDV
jgi:hypothetical protein